MTQPSGTTIVAVIPDFVDIEIFRGTDSLFDFIILDDLNAEGGQGKDITDDTVQLTVRDGIGETATVIISKSNGAGQHEDPLNGRTRFAILRTEIDDETNEKFATFWRYEIRHIDSVTARERVHLSGLLTVQPAVVAA